MYIGHGSGRSLVLKKNGDVSVERSHVCWQDSGQISLTGSGLEIRDGVNLNEILNPSQAGNCQGTGGTGCF